MAVGRLVLVCVLGLACSVSQAGCGLLYPDEDPPYVPLVEEPNWCFVRESDLRGRSMVATNLYYLGESITFAMEDYPKRDSVFEVRYRNIYGLSDPDGFDREPGTIGVPDATAQEVVLFDRTFFAQPGSSGSMTVKHRAPGEYRVVEICQGKVVSWQIAHILPYKRPEFADPTGAAKRQEAATKP